MNLDAVLLSIQGKLPKDLMTFNVLKEKFEKLSDDKKQEAITRFSMLNLKSPAFVFWVGNFLFGNFGVARFMIGDKVLGFVRLGITILAIIFSIIADISLDEEAAEIFNGLSGLAVIANWIIWWFVDLFLVGKRLRMQNFEKIMQTIALVTTATQATQTAQQAVEGVMSQVSDFAISEAKNKIKDMIRSSDDEEENEETDEEEVKDLKTQTKEEEVAEQTQIDDEDDEDEDDEEDDE